MSDEQISLLERYILEDDKDNFFSTLVKNSETYINMKLLDHINRFGIDDLPSESKGQLQAYLSEPRNRDTLIHFKVSLLELSKESDAEKRKDLIRKFNDHYLSINLQYGRPANIKQSGNLMSQFETTLPSTFTDDKFDLSNCIEYFYNQPDWTKINEFRPEYYYKFDLARLLDKKTECFEHVFDNLASYTHVDNIPKLLKRYIAEKRKVNQGFALTDQSYNKMPLDQLEQLKDTIELIKDDTRYISTLFEKSFERELGTLQYQDDLSDGEYRELLLMMYNWTDQLTRSSSFMSLRSQFLRAILEFDLKCNKLSKQHFIAYLENPNRFMQYMDANYTQSKFGMGYYDSFWHEIHRLKVQEWISDDKLVESYLSYFFKEMTNFGEFEKYFRPEFLKKQFYSAKIQNGENIENITKIFSEDELSELKESRKLKFESWNKTRFSLGEEIKLHLEIKNIQNFCVNIFEINTESYYRKNKNEISENINLTGLIPSKTTEHNLTCPPIISQVIEFKDLFQSKRGVFIVEFIGGGLSSRALIRIGALSLIRQVLSRGYLFHVVDEQKNICASATTDIIMGDKLFKPEPKLSNGILIPYSKTDISETAILRHEGFSEIQKLVIPSETLTFDMGLIFNEETLIAGSQVNFLLMPKMRVNGKAVANSTMNKLKADIRSTNDIGIDNTTTLNDIKLDGSNDAVINYLVPPKTEMISITVSGKFVSSAEDKEVDFSATRTIQINRFRDKYIYYGTYLSQSDQKYTISFLGKNGEPYPQQKVSVSLTPKYLHKTEIVEFETDSKGQIHLGELKNITNIHIQMIDSPCTEKYSSSYTIQHNDKIDTLPRLFDIVEGEDICFPLAADTYDAKDYELIRVMLKNSQVCAISNNVANISHEDGMLYLTKLTEGRFEFKYRSLCVAITVKVHKGKRWDVSADYLIRDRSILKLITQSEYLAYKDLKIDNQKVSLNILNNNMSSVQVHAFAYSYLPTTFNSLVQSVKSVKVSETSESFNFSKNSNIYLSEKNLADEIKYVLERKRKNTFMGNTLEKPSSLLKRHFVRDTNQDQEVLNPETGYGDAVRGQTREKPVFHTASQQGLQVMNYAMNNLSSFLGKEGWSQFNIKPDENGNVIIELPKATCYGTLVFVIKDSKNSIVETRSLHSDDKVFKHVALKSSKTANKVYLYDRIAHNIPKGETCEIKDLAATELSMVEDIQTLFKMLKLVSNKPELDEWDFIGKWNTLTPEDQIKKYDKYISHEFNLFTYFKDREFFNAVVKPHITNKSTKQFIDYFLLEETEKLRSYFSPAKLESLNFLETALLVKYFATSDPDKCKIIAQNSQLYVSSQKQNVKEFKRLFDSILKAQAATDALTNAAQESEHQARMQLEIAARHQHLNFGGVALTQTFVQPSMQQAYAQSHSMLSNIGPVMHQQTMNFNQQQQPSTQPFTFNTNQTPAGALFGAGPTTVGGGTFGGSPFGGPTSVNFGGSPFGVPAPAGFRGSPPGGFGGFGGPSPGVFGGSPFGGSQPPVYQQPTRSMAYRIPQSNSYDPFASNDIMERASDGINSAYGVKANKVDRYRTLGVTKEYIEKQYFTGDTCSISLKYNKFWADYIDHCINNDGKAFISSSFIYAVGSLTEMIAAIAVSDLPFDKCQHSSQTGANQLKITAGSNCIVFSKEIQEKGDQKVDIDVLISQRFYDPFDRYMYSPETNTKMLKNVTEFLVGKLYMSRVAITNSSETRHEINLVTEIPQGSVPVVSLEYMKSTSLAIEPLSIEVIEFNFYFPSEGEFTCYPASINKDGCLVTTAAGINKLKVVRNRQMPELKTITDILSMGSKSDILGFMEKVNFYNKEMFSFTDIYWLLDDEQFYRSVLDLLRKRLIYNEVIWSFSVKHGDYDTFIEYLQYSRFKTSTISFRGDTVQYLKTPIINIDNFTFKEYNPLINPRVHDIGEHKHNILNRDFKKTYLSFLQYLCQKTLPSAKDYTYFCTYMLLQDRVDDCLALYAHIDRSAVSDGLQIQYDYLTAYLDLYSDYPKFTKARQICAEYLTYPVFSWRNRFIDLLNQISEFDGETELLEKQTDETDADKNQREAKKEEYIAGELAGKTLKITSKNIKSVAVKFYKVDLEIMFSQDPFLSVDKNDYSYVTPNHTEQKELELTTEYSTDIIPIPESLVSSNLIIQVSSGALSENLTYFPTTMKVFIVKNYGQIKVTAEGSEKPLSNVYIKCFSKKSSGTVAFYKDGYTDLRGTFEYTSVHSSDFDDVDKFSILVFSDKHGALIKQTKPPTAIAKVEVSAHNIISTKLQHTQNHMRSIAANKYMKM